MDLVGSAEAPRPEAPQRAFTDASNSEIGLMIPNRGLSEVEVLKDGSRAEIDLMLLRSVGWLSRDDMPVRQGHAGPAFEMPGGQVIGKWASDYSIIPHKGDWHEASQHACVFEIPLRATVAHPHPGELTTTGSFISHSPAEYVISTVKETKNGKGWIVRGYNISSETIQLHLKPMRRFGHAKRINLAEEEISPLEIDGNGNIEILVYGHKIVSVMFSDLPN